MRKLACLKSGETSSREWNCRTVPLPRTMRSALRRIAA
jgi:hypothetical protein